MKSHKFKQWVFYTVVFFITIALARAAHAGPGVPPLPAEVGEWDEWIRSHWNVEFAQGEAFVETRVVEIPQCFGMQDLERRVFAELGEFTEITRSQAEPRYPAQALQWIFDPVEGREDLSKREYAQLRAELGRGLKREGFILISVTRAEVPYAITRVGIWQRECSFYVLTTATED